MTKAKILGRRLFAKATVGVPTALTFGQHMPPPTSIANCGVPASTVDTTYDAAKETLRQKIWKALRNQPRAEEERQSVANMRRMMMGGLDPDLAVLNSMSLARRVQIQCDREIERREKNKGLRTWIVRSMGGNPEDFE